MSRCRHSAVRKMPCTAGSGGAIARGRSVGRGRGSKLNCGSVTLGSVPDMARILRRYASTSGTCSAVAIRRAASSRVTFQAANTAATSMTSGVSSLIRLHFVGHPPVAQEHARAQEDPENEEREVEQLGVHGRARRAKGIVAGRAVRFNGGPNRQVPSGAPPRSFRGSARSPSPPTLRGRHGCGARDRGEGGKRSRREE